MEYLKNLINRYWRTGVIFLVGLTLIIYIAFGFVYLQQGPKQAEAEQQINQIRPVLMRSLPSHSELQTEYDRIATALASMSDKEAISKIVSIAEDSGIDIGEDAGKFQIPSAKYRKQSLGGTTYNVMSFVNITVQGEHEKVMEFIYAVQSGAYLKTMSLKRVVISGIDVHFTGEEGERRAEFRDVMTAVAAMMEDNDLQLIPNPMGYEGGLATNLMGDDSDTEGMAEGFPDIATTPAERGYTGTASLRSGYVLFEHHRISTGNSSQYEVVNYCGFDSTYYYYTCEADGTVRQWSGGDLVTATEYVDTTESVVETRAVVDVDIYSK